MTRFVAPILATALLLAAPAAGHAQLGKLMNKAKQQATGKADAAVAAQVPPRQVDALPANLTAADLDKAIAGLNAELAAAPGAKAEADRRNKQLEADRKAYEKAQKDYEKKSDDWNKCRDKIDKDPKLAAQREASEKKAEAMQERANREVSAEEMEALGKRAKPAFERMQAGKATEEDRRVIAEFQAKMAQVQSMSADMMAAVDEDQKQAKEVEARYAACGAEPQSPKSPDAMGASPEAVMQEAGAKATGMEAPRYALVREYAIMSSTMRVNTKGRSQADADAINAKLDELSGVVQKARSAGIPL